jgi:hypothetical protein
MRTASQPTEVEAPPLARFVDADSTSFLEQLATSRLVQAGAVNLIGLDAIRDRLGSRWLRRQADVWLYVDKAIERLLSDQAYFRRVSETDFVIAVAGASAGTAQAMCLKVLTETLTHFLGECAVVDLVIRNVTAVGTDQMVCAPIDISALPSPDEIGVVAIAAPTPTPAMAADRISGPPWVLTSATGLSLDVDYALEPFVNLRNTKVAGLCVAPVVRDKPTGRRIPGFVLSRLPDSDLARVDSLGLTFAQSAPATSCKAQSLIVPLSFQTLSSSKLRAAALNELRARHLSSAWVVMLSHIDHGTPPSRLTEMASFIRPYCDAVFACVPATSPSFGYLSECRFQGLVIDLERWAKEPERVAHYLQVFGEKAAGLASVLAVSGLASEAMFPVARAAGLTHASVRDPGRARPA